MHICRSCALSCSLPLCRTCLQGNPQLMSTCIDVRKAFFSSAAKCSDGFPFGLSSSNSGISGYNTVVVPWRGRKVDIKSVQWSNTKEWTLHHVTLVKATAQRMLLLCSLQAFRLRGNPSQHCSPYKSMPNYQWCFAVQVWSQCFHNRQRWWYK